MIIVSYRQSAEQNVFNSLGVRGMTLHRADASSSFPRKRESIATGVMWTAACAGVTTKGRRGVKAGEISNVLG